MFVFEKAHFIVKKIDFFFFFNIVVLLSICHMVDYLFSNKVGSCKNKAFFLLNFFRIVTVFSTDDFINLSPLMIVTKKVITKIYLSPF